MKRTIITLVCLFIAFGATAQEKKGFLQRIKEKNTTVVYDTIYIYIESQAPDTTSVEERIENEEDIELEGSIPVPFDTLDTDDKFQKILLFDDFTWAYFDITKPILPDTLDTDHWDTEQVHSYLDVELKDLPEEITLELVDSIHDYCIPHKGPVVSQYKYRGRHPHKGVDISLNKGDAIYAAFDGVVRVALPTRFTGGYGNILVIRHANGLETYYGHLSKYIVNSGDVVKAGELIGYGGSTGRSTGPHLHFETRYMGKPFDPERIFDFENKELRETNFTLKKHYFNINSHYGQSDKQSIAAGKEKPKPTQSSAVYHKIKSGDTLSKIAKKYKTSVKAICKLNKIKETKVLQIGQKLRVK